MLKVRRMLFWNWRPSVVRIGMGAIFYVPGFMIQLGHYNPPCRVCGDRGVECGNDAPFDWDGYRIPRDQQPIMFQSARELAG